MADLYRKADLVSFVSTYEGFGLPIIEAQATGRPVLTSGLHSMPEVAGDGAWFVDPFDVESIRSGFRALLGERTLRERLVAAGLRNVKRFDPRTVARQYSDLYREVAAEAEAADAVSV
jgi:glycosyltransferase involved in cell wall biosynthesis